MMVFIPLPIYTTDRVFAAWYDISLGVGLLLGYGWILVDDILRNRKHKRDMKIAEEKEKERVKYWSDGPPHNFTS